MPGTRRERVEELIVREVSDILRREVNDPRIGFVTVTDAEISPDLRAARVFVSALGSSEEVAAALQGLNRAAGFIRGEFGRRANLRFNPTIEFRVDPSIERGARIHQLLAGLRETEEHEPESPAPGGERDPDGE